MINGAVQPRAGAADLRFEHGDARLEFVVGQRIEILLGQQHQRIVGALGQDIVQVHGGEGLRRDRVCQSRCTTVRRLVGTGGLSRSPLAAVEELSERDPSLRPDDQMHEIPTTMRAIDPDETGGPDVLRPVARPVPHPGPNELLIKVAAAGINRPDVLQRQGKYPPPPGAPSIPGLEVAGEVVALGDGADARLMGRPVMALVAGGGYAEYAVAPSGQCMAVPPSLTMIEAAALPETLFTVWSNLFERGRAAPGETVLVHGGTSGIGTTAIALGKLFGLTVIVTAGSAEKCARARELGADHAIDYKEQDFVAEVKRHAPDGVQIVLDMIGGDYLPRNLDCLAPEGRHISIAVQRGATAELPIHKVMTRRLTLTGSTLRPRDIVFKTRIRDALARAVWPLLAAGRLKPVIDSTFPLHDARLAHSRLDSGDHVGKIVLTIP
jgi:NADPH:quinone reductase